MRSINLRNFHISWKSILGLPLFLLFIGIYPTLFLYSQNFSQIEALVLFPFIKFSLIVLVLFFLFFLIITRSLKKSSLLSIIGFSLFFSYGHVYNILKNISIFGLQIFGHKVLLPLFLILLGIFGIIFFKSKNDQKTIKIFNYFSIILFLLISLQILTLFAISKNATLQNVSQQNTVLNGLPKNIDTTKNPNIYYILVDNYARDDLLLKSGFDNSSFINALKEAGFIIPSCGQSNYNDTASSLASTLNMQYLDELVPDQNLLFFPIRTNTLGPLIKQSAVQKIAKQFNYQFIASETLYPFLNISNADIYYKSEDLASIKFYSMAMDTTVIKAYNDFLVLNPELKPQIASVGKKYNLPNIYGIEDDQLNYLLYKKNVTDLKNLRENIYKEGGHFIYAHLLVVHKPFGFTETGQFQSSDTTSYNSYINQVKYLNGQLLELVNSIKENSEVEPIIIIQSDHSFTTEDNQTTQNFQAYFLPGFNSKDFDKYFTNVNTFRLIFDNYFGEDLPLLPNKSYLISAQNPSLNKLQEPSCSSK